MKLALALLPVLACAPLAHGDDPRRLYDQGQRAFAERRYQLAYDDFASAYRSTHLPGLLYNMSSALLGLHRPRDAAEALRSYLVATPGDPDREAIEERIHTLELLGPSQAPPFQIAPRPLPSLRRWRAGVIVAVVAAALAVAVAGVTIGVVLSPSSPAATASSFGGPVTITR